jgi:hypothetical protein
MGGTENSAFPSSHLCFMFVVMISRNLAIFSLAGTFKARSRSRDMRSCAWGSTGAKARASGIQVGSGAVLPEGGSGTRGRRRSDIRKLRRTKHTMAGSMLRNEEMKTSQIHFAKFLHVRVLRIL